MNRKKIAIIFAMEDEANIFLKTIEHEPFDIKGSLLPFRYFRSEQFDNIELIVAWNGRDAKHDVDNVGTVPSAVNAFNIINLLQPDLIINAGTAGGLKSSGLSIGQVLLSSKTFYFHHRRIPGPNWDSYGMGFVDGYCTKILAKKLGHSQAAVSSGDSFFTSEEDLATLKLTGGEIKDMEAAAIAWVCRETRTDFFAIKAITDLVDQKTEDDQFTQNFNLAMNNLVISLFNTIKMVSNDFS